MNSLSSANDQSWLSWFLRGALFLVFLLLATKLFETQVIKGSYYRTLSEENRVRHIPIPAPRGKILARGGEGLAGNVEVKRRITYDSSGAYVLSDDLTGASPNEIVTDYKRVYWLGAKAAHVVGYLGQVGAEQVGKVDPSCPEKGPVPSTLPIGKTGLEAEYECELRGTPGEELIEVDIHGKKIRSLGVRNAVPGQNIQTTIDYNLQSEIATNMDGKPGAAIITDVKGQVLAFYSSPSFDPGLFIGGGNKAKLSQLFTDKNLPFFDRVISGTFHPGSVFKPLVAISALEEGAIDKNFTFTDPGEISVNSFSYSNWYFTEYGRTEGTIGLARAIARSTDTFFYKIGEMVGPDAIAKWADAFGLGARTGIDLPSETFGLIPTTDWKKQKIKESWFLGDTYHVSIGQGYVAVTPIELNSYISAIASNGYLCRPRINQKEAENCKKINVSQNNLDLVKRGMKEACQSGGTAYTFFDFSARHAGQSIACKTGTAEVGTDGTPHAWFTLFTPIENPQIVGTILFEKGGQGSSVAGPVARKMVDFYFQSNMEATSSGKLKSL